MVLLGLHLAVRVGRAREMNVLAVSMFLLGRLGAHGAGLSVNASDALGATRCAGAMRECSIDGHRDTLRVARLACIGKRRALPPAEAVVTRAHPIGLAAGRVLHSAMIVARGGALQVRVPRCILLLYVGLDGVVDRGLLNRACIALNELPQWLHGEARYEGGGFQARNPVCVVASSDVERVAEPWVATVAICV